MTVRPRVVVTRDLSDAEAVVDALDRQGLDGWVVPTIAIAAPIERGPLDDALSELSRFAWVVFTSARGVDAVCGLPAWRRGWHAGRARPLIGAAGPATAARLARHGVPVAVLADRGGANALAAGLTAHAVDLAGVRVLWPRADIASLDFAARLAAGGAEVVAPVAYRTQAVPHEDLRPLLSAIDARAVDAITFFSPSAAASLARALDGSLAALAGHVTLAAVGATTAEAMSALGAPPDVVSPAPTAAALAGALARHLAAPGGRS